MVVDAGLSLVGVILEEFLIDLGVVDAAEDAQFSEVQIADGSAAVSTLRGARNNKSKDLLAKVRRPKHYHTWINDRVNEFVIKFGARLVAKSPYAKGRF